MDNSYALIPYAVVDGVPSFKDSEIAGWFERLEKENLARWAFFGGALLSGAELVRFVKTAGIFTFTVWAGGAGAAEMVGFFWLDRFVQRACFLHHVIFRKFHGAEATAIGVFVLSEVLRLGMADTILGLTPANNPLAVRYARRIGMQPAGRLPNIFYDAYANQSVDGILTYTTREA